MIAAAHGPLLTALLTALLSAAAPAQEAWRDALAEGEYGRALELAQAEPAALARARARAEIFYLGRDFPACRQAADEGLAAAPGDLYLLSHAAESALWLRDGELAAGYVRELQAAVESVPPSGRADLPAEHLAWWRETAASYGAQAAELRAASEARARSLARARRTVLLLTSLSLALLAWTGLRSGR